MSQSPSELSDEALLAMLHTSESTLDATKIATSDVFNRLACFNDVFSQLETKPNRAALMYRDSASDQITWREIGDRLVVGRAPKVTAGVPGAILKVVDEEMSRQHFEIVRSSDGLYTITDRDSTNGLFINESKVKTAFLIGGMAIRAGRTLFLFTGS